MDDKLSFELGEPVMTSDGHFTGAKKDSHVTPAEDRLAPPPLQLPALRPWRRKFLLVVGVFGLPLVAFLLLPLIRIRAKGSFPLRVSLQSRVPVTKVWYAYKNPESFNPAWLDTRVNPKLDLSPVSQVKDNTFGLYVACSELVDGWGRPVGYEQQRAMVLQLELADGKQFRKWTYLPDGRQQKTLNLKLD